MSETHYREGNVVLYKRERSTKFQARLKMTNGRWKRISTGESSLEEASKVACEKYDELRFKIKHKIVLDSRRFKDVARIAINEMQKELDAGYGKKSYVDYIQAINRYFVPYFGNTFINNVDYKKLKEFDNWRQDKVGRELKQSTLNNHNAGLKRIFKVAVDRQWIHSFQIPELKNKGVKSKRRPYFTLDEYRTLYRFMRRWSGEGQTEKYQMMRELLRDYVLIVVNTGMRPGTEMDNLQWKNIEEFEQNGTRYVRFWVDGKTGNRELIARHNVRRYLNRIRSRFEGINPEDYVFRMRNGERTKSLNGTFERCLKACNLLEDRHGNIRTLYSLRHTYATFQILNGVDYHTLSKNMGTSISMLEKHYSHLTPSMKAKELAGKDDERRKEKI